MRAAVLLVLLGPLLARAEERLPFNPFENAHAGDWSLHEGRFEAEGTGEKPERVQVYSFVASVTSDEVVVEERAKLGAIEKTKRRFSPTKAPTLEEFFDLREGTITEVAWARENRRAADAICDCQKVVFTWTRGEDASYFVAWLSPQVGGGLVSLLLRRSESLLKLDLAGAGVEGELRAGRAAWDLLDDEMLGTPLVEAVLRWNPLVGRTGEWTVYRRTKLHGVDEPRPGVFTFQVASVNSRGCVVSRGFEGQIEGDLRSEVKKWPLAIGVPRAFDVSLPASLYVYGLAVAGSVREIAGHEFFCERVSFTVREGSLRMRVIAELSRDVPPPGVVTLDVELTPEDTTRYELAGFGDVAGTRWGKSVHEVFSEGKK